MKRYFSLLLFLLAAAIAMPAQTAPAAAELTRLVNEFLAGAGRNDAAVHDRFWADDLIYTRSAGARIGKEELMKGVRTAPAAKPGDPVTVYTAEDVRIQQYGNAAVFAFRLVGTTTRPDGSKTTSNHFNTGVFVNRAGKWQAVAWQATTIPAAEPAAKPALPAPPVETKAAPAAASQAESVPLQKSTPSESRTYLKGPRGGCYYLGSGGKKIYVDHSNCK